MLPLGPSKGHVYAPLGPSYEQESVDRVHSHNIFFLAEAVDFGAASSGPWDKMVDRIRV